MRREGSPLARLSSVSSTQGGTYQRESPRLPTLSTLVTSGGGRKRDSEKGEEENPADPISFVEPVYLPRQWGGEKGEDPLPGSRGEARLVEGKKGIRERRRKKKGARDFSPLPSRVKEEKRRKKKAGRRGEKEREDYRSIVMRAAPGRLSSSGSPRRI